MAESKGTYRDQSHKYYFDNPEIWERLRGQGIEKEITYLRKVFENQGNVRRILDVGCGTGVHCKALTDLGYEVVGVDLNESMIKYAQDHYPESTYHVGDMRTLEQLNLGSFDAVLCLCTTFAYNVTLDEVRKTLGNFHRALNRNGRLVIEVFNPISFLEKLKFQGSFFLEEQEPYAMAGLRVEVAHTVNEPKQTLNEQKKYFKIDDNDLIKEDTTEYRLFFPQEMRAYVESSGFEVLQQNGRYEYDYTQLDRTRLITLARKI